VGGSADAGLTPRSGVSGEVRILNRCVFLDRDGVINQDSHLYVKSPEEWVPLPGSIEAIGRLYHAGFRILIVTNQSGLARGLFDISQLNTMHQKLRDLVSRQGARIEMIGFCPHAPEDQCLCRKPRTGLLVALASRLGVDLVGLPFIGDSLSDLQAARAAGMQPWLVLTGKDSAAAEVAARSLPDEQISASLGDAAEKIIQSWGRA